MVSTVAAQSTYTQKAHSHLLLQVVQAHPADSATSFHELGLLGVLSLEKNHSGIAIKPQNMAKLLAFYCMHNLAHSRSRQVALTYGSDSTTQAGIVASCIKCKHSESDSMHATQRLAPLNSVDRMKCNTSFHELVTSDALSLKKTSVSQRRLKGALRRVARAGGFAFKISAG